MNETRIQQAVDFMVAVADGEADTSIVCPTIWPGSGSARIARNEREQDEGTGIELTLRRFNARC